ncbi:MAG: hypothetical protein AB1439_12780 [candidate division FCPU426 bacterium]
MRKSAVCLTLFILAGGAALLPGAALPSEAESEDWGASWLEQRHFSRERLAQEADVFRQTRRLFLSVNARAEYDARGRMVAKRRADGSEEQWRYGTDGSSATVWETGADNQLLEERYYWRGRLQARLQKDGTLQVFHALGLLAVKTQTPDNDVPALYVSVTDKIQNRILLFNSRGRLLAGYHADGTPWSTQSSGGPDDLEQIIPVDLLVQPDDQP